MLHFSDISLVSGIKGFLYLDPGSGSVLLQVLIALLLGIGIAVRVQWSRIKSLFASKKNADTPPQHDK